MLSDTTSPPTSAGLAVDVRRFSWMRRLATDYAFEFRHVERFFAGNPADEAAWAAAIRRRQAHAIDRDGIVAVLARQQTTRGAPPEARAAAQRLTDPNAVVVVTGQQAGLFGGPLFTLLKAITAIKLAREVERRHGVPAVTVFWIDAEDHDWPEVRGCSVLDAELATQTVELAELRGAGEWPIGRLQLDEHIGEALAALEGALPASDFRGALLEQLADAYRPGRSMAEAFGRWLERVLGPHGVVVYDASDPAAKPLARPVFAKELAQPGHTTHLAAKAGADLIAAGYHAQVTPAEGAVALFYLNDGREGIRVVDGQATIGERHLTLSALADELASSPQHFSPNVLLRPIVQDTLFPTVCYVAGPNELAYLGQLREVYAHHGVPMPLMYQRASATLVDSATLRFLAKYELPLEALQPRGDARLNHLLESQLPPTVEQSLTKVSTVVDAHMAEVALSVPQIDATLAGTVQSTLSRMQQDLRTLHNKVIQAAKRKDETLRRQFHHAQALTFPNGHPQEREIGFVSFLNRYGPVLVERLIDDLPLQMGRHWILTV